MKLSLIQAGLYTLGLSLIATSARGQITPDGSLPTKVEQQGNVAEITGGEQAGNNLFHSFQDFSVSTGNEAFFNNGIDINNILSRVTGGNISSIDGLIRSNGTANLFLINPAGIIFGENARLDVGGSFLGSTATGLLFDDGTEFSAKDLAAPVLTINAPIGLNLRGATGDISSTGNLNSDRDLTLAADNLSLQGKLQAGNNLTLQALDTIEIKDSINQPAIATAGNELSLQGDRTINLSILNNGDSGLFSGGDLILRSNNPINGDAHYYSGGNFRIEQLDGTLGNFISIEDPVVRSQGDVSFASYEGASLHILAGGSVTVDGDIRITGTDTTANSLQEIITLSNGGQININGSAEPTLDIRAGTTASGTPVIIEGFTANTTATGSNININGTVNNPGGTVFLTNQYQPNTTLTGGDITTTAINTSNSLGNGGNVTVDSRNDINIPNGINTASTVDSQLTTVANLQTLPETTIASGNGGAIALLAVRDITSGNFNTASTVNLNLITEVDTIEEANTGFPFPQANIQAGTGGVINLRAGNNINVGNLNSNSAIAINSDSVSLDSFSIIGAFLELNTGDGGKVNLQAGNNLTTFDINSNVAVSDRLTSNVETTPNITLSVSQITLNIPQANLGSGGEIWLEAGDRLKTGSLNSSVAVNNNSNNQATILANDPTIATAERPSRAISELTLTSENMKIGSGGNITINSDKATVGNVNSSIGVSSENIVFAEANANNGAAANSSANSNISFNVLGDRPGTITFNADSFNFGTLNAAVTNNGINNLDSQANIDGENANDSATPSAIATVDNSSNKIFFDSEAEFALIDLNLPISDVDFVMGAVQDLSQPSLETTALNPCPINPNAVNNQPKPIETAQGKIYPAMGVEIKNGVVRLTAQPTAGNAVRVPGQFNSCN
jgi:filamentous hemagglutinin family protein